MRQAPALLAAAPDVENTKDFNQYYKNRYFGFRPDKAVLPCILDRNSDRSPLPSSKIAVCYFEPEKPPSSAIIDFKDFSKGGYFFGAPSLGNVTFGPSYAHIQGLGYRESIKGIGLNRLKAIVPNQQFVLGKFGMGKDQKLIHMISGGRYFSHPDEAEFIYQIYNKTYFDWHEALQALERGDRLGCQVTKQVGLYLEEGQEYIQISYKNFECIGHVVDANRIEILEGYKFLIPALEHILYPLNLRLAIT